MRGIQEPKYEEGRRMKQIILYLSYQSAYHISLKDRNISNGIIKFNCGSNWRCNEKLSLRTLNGLCTLEHHMVPVD